uniref:Uncharacterized protein n=1 Tax=viral metagenome TaxID=1070528 RepID=A0A6M3ITV4_9ZZZZ
MNLEDAIRILSNSSIQIRSHFADEEFCGEALSFAISVLEKLAERDVMKSNKIDYLYHNIAGTAHDGKHRMSLEEFRRELRVIMEGLTTHTFYIGTGIEKAYFLSKDDVLEMLK